MRPRPRRPALRAALDAAAVPTFTHKPADGPIRFTRAPGRLPPGLRVYAIADIHGWAEKLTALHRLIEADLSARPIPRATIAHLGNYLGHGPDSAAVVHMLAAGPPHPHATWVNLLGDHERMLLDAMDGDRPAATDFLHAGGSEALASWGLDRDLPRDAWQAALPADDVAWLRSLALTHRVGDYLFVHAGIRPGVPLEAQSREDLTAMRQPFLSTEQDFGVVVVHGHSSSPTAMIARNRIGLDTGAGTGGKLTCVMLQDDALGLLAV
jgi:serine/threonine protein phosphatase 1